MGKVVFYWFLLYFLIECSRTVPVRPNYDSRSRRSIDLISSLEHISDVRLPRDVTPTKYTLQLQPILEIEEFRGRITINITCLEDTDKIILHADQELEISEKDIIVFHIPSTETTTVTTVGSTSSTVTTTNTQTSSPIETTTSSASVKPTEPVVVAPVPIGAARLVPISSRVLPENACLPTNKSCTSGSTTVTDSESQESMAEELPKPQPLAQDKVDNMETTEHATAGNFSKDPKTYELHLLRKFHPPARSSTTKPVELKVLKTERQLNKQWFIIYVSGGLKRGEEYWVHLKFKGPLSTNSKDGFFIESYVDKRTGEKRQYAATQLRPNHARRVFPCFDEPSYKVPFDIRVAHYSNLLNALSNERPLNKTQSLQEEEWTWDNFHTTPPMSTFSVAVLLSDLQPVENPKYPESLSTKACALVTTWGRRGMLSPLKNAGRIAPTIVSEIEKYLDRPLPIGKLDLIALPGYSAIPDSNWGMIFFRESDLYSDEHLVKHITRELVYQWIGNLITPHWWSDVHINKALCNFIADVISLKINTTLVPNSNLWIKTYPLYYEYGRNQPYKQLPSQKPPKTVTKTELILRMLNYTLSETTFQMAMRQLIEDREFKTFTQDDIWAVLTERAGMDGMLPEPATINQIADSWIKKERLPLVTVTRDYQKNSAQVEQTVFLRDHLEENTTDLQENLTWFIPLVVVAQNDLNFTSMRPMAWMKEEKMITLNDLPTSSYFIIVNPEEIGPFIVNYDTHNWLLLSEFLEKYANNGQIPPGTRAKLVHDSLNLAYAGNLRWDSALNVTKFLYNEKDPIVWQAAFNMFDHIQRHLEGGEVATKFQEYIKHIISNVYSYLEKLETKQTKSQERMYKSAKSALCNAGYEPCVKEARAQWKKWMDFQEPDAGIPISQSHFCWVFKWGTKEEWEFGLERYLRYPANLKQADRYYLLKTLVSCPSNSWNVERVLNMTMLDPNTTITDGNARFILSVLSNQAGYTALFNLLADNWDAIRSRYDNKESGLWDNIVSAATRNFKDQDGLNMVSELYVERQGEFGSAETVIEQSLRHIKKEVKWNEENLSVIDQWLTDYLSGIEGIGDIGSPDSSISHETGLL